MSRSTLIALLAVTVCVSRTMAASEIPSVASVWQQCGGKSCSMGQCKDAPWAHKSCAPGLKCFRDTEFYWQCRTFAKVYEQCGGKSCQVGNMCKDSVWAECQDNHSCVRKNEFYWQCLPAGTAAAAKASLSGPASAHPAHTQSSMRVSQALSAEQLAHVPIPRHSIIVSKTAEPAAVSVASIPVAAIRPVAAEQIRPVSTSDVMKHEPIAVAAKSAASVASATTAPSSTGSNSVSTAAVEPKSVVTPASTIPSSSAEPMTVKTAVVSSTAAAEPTKVQDDKIASDAEPQQHRHEMRHSPIPSYKQAHIYSDADTDDKDVSVARTDGMRRQWAPRRSHRSVRYSK